jgi:hypothetical protein
MEKTDYAMGLPLRFAVALHGYGSRQKGIILGGRADREAKCLVAARIQDELEAARGHREEIGFRIFDDAEAARVPGAAVARRPSAGAAVSPTTTGACTASTAAF